MEQPIPFQNVIPTHFSPLCKVPHRGMAFGGSLMEKNETAVTLKTSWSQTSAPGKMLLSNQNLTEEATKIGKK